MYVDKIIDIKLLASAIIFDLDGTLVNSLDDLADNANAALSAYSFPTYPVEAYKYFVGQGARRLLMAALPEGTPESLVKLVGARYYEEYSRGWAIKSRPYDGILPMLERLAGMRVPMAVLSNKPHAFTGDFTRRFFPETRFIAVQGSPEGGTAKPDPAMALALAKTMRLPPEQIVFMGDSRTDMETAVNAGMLPVGAAWGFRPESELLEYGARAILARPADLFEKVSFSGGC